MTTEPHRPHPPVENPDEAIWQLELASRMASSTSLTVARVKTLVGAYGGGFEIAERHLDATTIQLHDLTFTLQKLRGGVDGPQNALGA